MLPYVRPCGRLWRTPSGSESPPGASGSFRPPAVRKSCGSDWRPRKSAGVAGRVERALEPLGVERAATGFRPHVTIGRWRRPEPRGADLREELARWRDHEFGKFRIHAVTLFRSTLRPAGALYSPLAVFPLDAAAGPPTVGRRPGARSSSQPMTRNRQQPESIATC